MDQAEEPKKHLKPVILVEFSDFLSRLVEQKIDFVKKYRGTRRKSDLIVCGKCLGTSPVKRRNEEQN
jgi:hypothetical protein